MKIKESKSSLSNSRLCTRMCQVTPHHGSVKHVPDPFSRRPHLDWPSNPNMQHQTPQTTHRFRQLIWKLWLSKGINLYLSSGTLLTLNRAMWPNLATSADYHLLRAPSRILEIEPTSEVPRSKPNEYQQTASSTSKKPRTVKVALLH